MNLLNPLPVRTAMLRLAFVGLTALSLTASAAKNRDLILLAVPVDDVDRGVYRLVESKLRDRGEVENASLAYRELHEPAPLTQGRLDHPIPGWWPKALVWDWESGVAACKTRSPAPYGPENTEGRLCGGRLAAALWERYLEHQKADLVVQVVMEPVNPQDVEVDDRQRLRVRAFVPNEPAQRIAERREVEFAEVREVAAVLALRVASGGGAAEPRVVLRALPTPKAKVDEPIPDLAAVKPPRGCRAEVPSGMTVDPADARLSQILVRHWAASARGLRPTLPPLSCALDVEARPERVVGTNVLLGSAILTCGGRVKVIAKLHKTTQAALDDALSEEVVKKLIDGYCRGKYGG